MKKGFTLIELLVVVAIIGLLASVVMTSLSDARTKARNTKKIAEVRNISLALQMYYEQTGGVPANPSQNWSQIDGTLFAPIVSAGFLPQVPTSPDNEPYYYYDYGSYVMVATNAGAKYGPGARGWHCSDITGGTGTSKYYCVEFNK